MVNYNIIYTSPSETIYLWNGRALDSLKSKDREALKYSGKAIKDDNLEEELQNCLEAVKQFFPADTSPKIKRVEIKVR